MAHAANGLELLDDITAQRAALGLRLGFHRPSSSDKAVHVSCLISRAAKTDNVPFRIGNPCCRRHGHPYRFSASVEHNRLFPCRVVFIPKHTKTPKQRAHRELGTTPRSVINF
jgi:hypothetical protein